MKEHRNCTLGLFVRTKADKSTWIACSKRSIERKTKRMANLSEDGINESQHSWSRISILYYLPRCSSNWNKLNSCWSVDDVLTCIQHRWLYAFIQLIQMRKIGSYRNNASKYEAHNSWWALGRWVVRPWQNISLALRVSAPYEKQKSALMCKIFNGSNPYESFIIFNNSFSDCGCANCLDSSSKINVDKIKMQ